MPGREEKPSPPPSPPPQTPSQQPPTELGREFDKFMSSILTSASGQKATLSSYNEVAYEEVLIISAVYTLPTPVSDHAALAENIRDEIAKRGVSKEVIFINIDPSQAAIGVGGGTSGFLTIGGKIVGEMSIYIYKNSKDVEVHVTLASG